MFCTNCGRGLPDEAKFCPDCGTTVRNPKLYTQSTYKIEDKENEPPHNIHEENCDSLEVPVPQEEQISTKSKSRGYFSRNKIWIIPVLVILVAGIIAVSVLHFASTPWERKYNQGLKDMAKGDYSQAIISFEAAIELDPLNMDAYNQLSEIYKMTGRYNESEDILCQGQAARGIRSLTITTYDEDDEIDNYQKFEYDNEGREIQFACYDSDGQLDGFYSKGWEPELEISSPRRVKSYTSDGKRLETIIYDHSGGYYFKISHEYRGDVPRKDTYIEPSGAYFYHTYKYNDDGSLLTSTYYRDGVYGYSSFDVSYKYDSLGRVVEISSDDESEKRVYEYDSTGHLAKEVYYDFGDMVRYDTYEYDENGRNIKITNHNLDDTVFCWETFSYNSDGTIADSYTYYEEFTLYERSVYEEAT